VPFKKNRPPQIHQISINSIDFLNPAQQQMVSAKDTRR
jgi:hypothetical protein